MKVKEEEIRPEKIFNEYLELTKKDVNIFFKNCEQDEISCPACNSENSENWVKKQTFNYEICKDCKTIFVNPRPKIEYFNKYYKDAPSTKYWATTFYKKTEKARRDKLWKPKAQMVKDLILKYQPELDEHYLIDIGGGYGTFDEEISKIMNIDITVIEPSIHLSKICKEKGFNVIEEFMENIKVDDLPKKIKTFVSFELFEHLHNPKFFLKTVYDTMKIGDVFIFTTLSGMGIDIQLLKKKAKAISPPHHLNFLNPKSISLLLANFGFKILEVSTPGKLDIDILSKNKQYLKNDFWINLIEYSNQDELEKLQSYIVDMGISSHMMITAKKI